MAKAQFYIERRQQGDYAVRKRGAGRASVVVPTQRDAEKWVKARFPEAKPRVERVRHTRTGGPGHWRKED